ncbi:MAG: hypothetical protein JWO59_677 [Chloroflexi bacterium]|nr:hypothetical protein [Chloroflexota bacterium]
MTFGLVSTLADPEPTKLACITDQFVATIDAVAPKCPIRAPLASATDSSFPTAIYRTALARYQAAGHPVIGVLAQEFHPGYLNLPLGLNGADPTLNVAIDAFSMRAMAVCRQLVGHGLAGAWCWNEPNISDQPAIGVLPPAVQPTALNPAVFGSLLYQTSRRLKAGGVPLVYAGALTCLEQFHTDPAGDWVAGYLDKAYAYLVRHGKTDFHWDFLSVNMEGRISPAYAAKTAAALRAVAAKYGHTVKLAVGEFGWQAGTAVDAVAAQATYDALSAAFDEVYFYAWQWTTPGDPTGYGAAGWDESSGAIGPNGRVSPWYSVLRDLKKG